MIMKIITSNKLAVLGVIFGPIVGLLYKDLASQFGYISDIYLTLMQLAVIPLIIVTITMGVLELIYGANTERGIMYLVLKICIVFAAVGVIATIATTVIQPWNSMTQNTEVLRIVYRTEPIIEANAIGVNDVIDNTIQQRSFGELVKSAIPSNIFRSLAAGNILQVIIFFIILSAAVGYSTVNTPSANIIRTRLESMFKILKSINGTILQFLPLMSFFILAYQMQSVSMGIFSALFSLVLCIFVVFVAIMIACILVVWYRSNQSLLEVLSALLPCIILAFFSKSTVVSSNLAMEALTNRLKFDHGTIQLVVPLGAGMLRFGTTSIYFIATLLTAHLFHISLGLYEYMMLSILAILASLVAISANGSVVTFYQTLGIALAPLGLPSNAVNSIFISLDFFTGTLEVIANVLGICALVAICSPQPAKEAVAPAFA